MFLWYCDVGWVKIYRCGSTKYLWRTGAMKARVSSSNLSLFLAIFAIFSIISFAFLLPTILYHWHIQTGDCSLWACWKTFSFYIHTINWSLYYKTNKLLSSNWILTGDCSVFARQKAFLSLKHNQLVLVLWNHSLFKNLQRRFLEACMYKISSKLHFFYSEY